MLSHPLAEHTSCPFGQSIPELPEPCLGRENILDTIDQTFEGSVDVFVIDGDEDQGKTVTAASCQRHKDRAFTLFLKTGSRWAYDPSIVRQELCQQLANALRKPLPEETPPDDATFRGLLIGLRRWVNTLRKPVYFVIDGVFEIPPTDTSSAKQIWDLLPFDMPGPQVSGHAINRFENRLVAAKVKKEHAPTVLHSRRIDQTLRSFRFVESRRRTTLPNLPGPPGVDPEHPSCYSSGRGSWNFSRRGGQATPEAI